tara:strand:+ start:911 stop:1774 length:864 start_codon:yes stop_codon:yes gene_type:complete
MSIKPENFDVLKNFLYEKSGIVIVPDKMYLLESRLSPILRKREMENLDALAQDVRSGFKKDLEKEVIEAMTTNETSFFRDQKPFHLFENVLLPRLMNNRTSRRIKIWCAACSSGQEPYSLAMLIKENQARFAGWNFEIIATDLDEKILDQAQKGRFSQFEVQRGLPITHLVKYFTQDQDAWVLNDEIKRMVTFRPLNLLDSFAALTGCDIVFCRNVLIYFDKETKAKIFKKIYDILPDNGYLVLGGAETVLGVTDMFKPLPERGSGYVKDKAPESAYKDNESLASAS